MGAAESHLAVGEASVWYLSSKSAVANILAFRPDAKFVVMLRNPIEMVEALHGEMLFVGNENIANFTEAWHAQADRKAGHGVPPLCWEPRWLQYGENCKLGAQLERLFGVAPGERVLVLTLDDIRRDARGAYQRVLRFLAVPDDGRTDFTARNTAKIRRLQWLPNISNTAVKLKHALGVRRGLGIWRHVDRWNQVAISRQGLEPKLERELKEYFAADVALLRRLVGRELGASWQQWT